MTAPPLSRRDLQFLLEEWLDAPALVTRPRFADHSAETFRAVLAVSEAVATAEFVTHNASSDQQEPTFDGERVHVIPEIGHALKAFAKTGLLAGAMDAEVGGIQLPHVVHQACLAWFQAANVATSAYPLLTMANANLLLAHATKEQIDRFVPPLLEGRWFGTMCLSEPQAGSSLADVATRAVRQRDGSYRVFGNKMWISGGDHEMGENILHLVLARVEGAPAGVKGLSLFATPKWTVEPDGTLGERNDVTLTGLNHKLGFRGTVNAALSFGEGRHLPGGAPGAVAHLVGEENRGLAVMFHMMNEARIGVGAGAAALGCASYQQALSYARGREQGRPIEARDPAGRPVPIIRHADVRRMLLASKSYVEGGLALTLYAARLLDEQKTAETDEERRRAAELLDVLIPVVKSWPSQWCLVANDLAIQVHGGYGYTREYPVEQMWRDNRLNPIHEGTHGIQAQDLLGRKLVRDDSHGTHVLMEAIGRTVAAARQTGDVRLRHHAEMVAAASQRMESAVAGAWESGKREEALVNATMFLEACGHLVVAWLWLDMECAANGRHGAFYDGKRAAATYFLTHELPRVAPLFDLVESGDQLVREVDESFF